jgi:hypothetical protein
MIDRSVIDRSMIDLSMIDRSMMRIRLFYVEKSKKLRALMLSIHHFNISVNFPVDC